MTDMMAGFPSPTEKDLKMMSKKDGFEKWMEKCKENSGSLHKMKWYRIILDEA
jgi:hypothetical protein